MTSANNVIQFAMKYAIEGLAVGVAAFLIPKRDMDIKAVIFVALTAAATFAILDLFSPVVALGSRQGSGFAIGFQQVGFGRDGKPIVKKVIRPMRGNVAKKIGGGGGFIAGPKPAFNPKPSAMPDLSQYLADICAGRNLVTDGHAVFWNGPKGDAFPKLKAYKPKCAPNCCKGGKPIDKGLGVI